MSTYLTVTVTKNTVTVANAVLTVVEVKYFQLEVSGHGVDDTGGQDRDQVVPKQGRCCQLRVLYVQEVVTNFI